MEYLISVVWTFIEVAFFIMFSSSFFEEKHKRKQKIIIYFLTCLFLFISLNLCPNQSIRLLISYFSLIVLSFVLFRGSVLRHLLVSVICFIFSGVIDTLILYGSCFLLGISLSEFVWRKLAYTAAVTIGKLFGLFLAWIIFRIRRKEGPFRIQTRWLLLTVTFPIVSLLMLSVVYISYQGRADLSVSAFAFSLGLSAANIAVLYLIHSMERQTQKEHAVILLNQQMQLQKDSIIALERSYRAQRQATHEFRHHLNVLGDLLSKNDVDSTKSYIESLQKTQSTRVLCINSHHPIIDAIINQKYQEAKDCDIDFLVQVNDLSTIGIATDAIAVLLSNLFDNAIEACEGINADRTIECRILAGKSLFVSIRNTSLPVVIIDKTIPTTKTPKEEHGYGLINIKHILESLKAEFTFQYVDGWFEFVTEIPLDK